MMHRRFSLPITLLMLCAILSVALAACTIEDASAIKIPTVQMGQSNFLQSSVTIQKGQRLKLLQDASDEHIITNGSWVGTAQHPAQEPGAPTVNATITGQGASATVGPFNTAGTFHLYCTIHQGMNLTVQVK